MKAGILTSISFAALLVLAVGCSKNKDLYGHWEGTRDWKTVGAVDENWGRTIAAIDVDLNADGTFVVRDMSLPYEGEWVDKGDHVDLTVLTVLRQPIAKQKDDIQKRASDFTLRYSEGKLYFKTPTDTTEIELKKKPKPQM